MQKKIKKVKVINYNIPIYDYKVSIVICESVLQGVENTCLSGYMELSKEEREEWKSYKGVFINHYGYEVKALVIPFTAKVDTITHEVYHLLEDIKREKGIVDEEAGAYLTGYLNKIVFHLIKKYSKKWRR